MKIRCLDSAEPVLDGRSSRLVHAIGRILLNGARMDARDGRDIRSGHERIPHPTRRPRNTAGTCSARLAMADFQDKAALA